MTKKKPTLSETAAKKAVTPDVHGDHGEPRKVVVMYDNARTTENTIRMYFHCRRCLEEFKAGVDHLGEPLGPMAPSEYCRLTIGMTEEGGWQVWCVRH